MEKFLDINQDWFSEKYLPLLGRKFWTFKIALNLFKQFGGKNIVETGCVREHQDYGAGYSTVLFAEYAKEEGATFESIEISAENIEKAKKELAGLVVKVGFWKGDSHEVLKNWQSPIDLLYLDSLDCDPENEEISVKAQQHQYHELELAYPNLSKRAIVLLDDNYFKNGGKTRLTKEFLKEKGFICIMDYEQSLWIR